MVINDDDYYIVHHEKKKIVSRVPYSSARVGFGMKAEAHPAIKSRIEQANKEHGDGHSVIKGNSLKHSPGYTNIKESYMENIYNQAPFSFASKSSEGFAPKAPVLNESVNEDKDTHDDGTPKSKGNAFDFKSFVSKKKEEAGENLRNHEKQKTATGTVYKRKEDANDDDDSETKGNSGEKRGRGRPPGKYGSYKKKIKEALEAYSLGRLDEVSKKTLGSYVKKAAEDIGDLSSDRRSEFIHKGDTPKYQKLLNKRSQRRDGVRKAVERLTKEDLDAMSQDEINSLIENFDQLDELSKATLGSYVKKSANDVHKNAYDQGKHDGRGTQSAYKKGTQDMMQAIKRRKGISKAVERLTKESQGE